MKQVRKIYKLSEREDKETKSEFNGTEKEWLKLIKTITAMANTHGGVIIFEKMNIGFSEVDSAELDDKINSFILPRIHNIVVEKYKKDGIRVKIPNSSLKPHIFKKDGIFTEEGKSKSEFYIGQIWVRHSSKNEIITPDDFHRFVKENLNEFLERINVIAAQYPIKELEISETGMPIKVKPIKDATEGTPAVVLKERIDPNLEYPYQTKDLGKLLNRNQNYIAKLLQVLGLKDDPEFSFIIKNSSGNIIIRKYNNKCFEKIKRFLIEKPHFNPWRDKL